MYDIVSSCFASLEAWVASSCSVVEISFFWLGREFVGSLVFKDRRRIPQAVHGHRCTTEAGIRGAED